MTLRKSVVPAALALAGCLSAESEQPAPLEQLTYQTPMLGGACEVEEVTYEVYADVLRPGGVLKSAATPGSLLVSVSESTSVIDCGEDVMRIATPGAELVREALASTSESAALTVPAAVIGGHRPSLRVAALLDLNDNGRCDQGELTASVDADGDELGALLLELTDEGCPGRE